MRNAVAVWAHSDCSLLIGWPGCRVLMNGYGGARSAVRWAVDWDFGRRVRFCVASWAIVHVYLGYRFPILGWLGWPSVESTGHRPLMMGEPFTITIRNYSPRSTPRVLPRRPNNQQQACNNRLCLPNYNPTTVHDPRYQVG